MKIDITSILYEEGKSIDIDKELDFSDIEFDGVKLSTPVRLVGKLFNIGGCIEFNSNASFEISYLCDRCLSESTKILSFDISERFKKTLDLADDQNPDIICFSGNEIDISEVIINNIFMNIPSKLLCCEECKGLCPVCGKNLNEGECSCDTRTSDPRFDVLDNFFK